MSIVDKINQWWSLDETAEKNSADNPLEPLSDDQKQNSFALLTLAFGWGFLVTGLMIGGALGAGVPFTDLLAAPFMGNSINFMIGAAAGRVLEKGKP